MAGQAGILDPSLVADGAAVAARFCDSLKRYGVDEALSVVEPGLLLHFQAHHVTPEDPLIAQPYRDESGLLVMFDGRLDNRDDLVAALRPLVPSHQPTDVELASAAYRRWGSKSFQRLIGDWSLAIYEPSHHRVVLASDYMGNRGLYYAWRDRRAVWSTDAEWVGEVAGLPDEIERRFIAGFVGLETPPHLTARVGIYAVPPGHSVALTAGHPPVIERFWAFPAGEIRFARSEDYGDALRDLLVESVKVRLRSTGPVATELSGGYDSSTVTMLAHRLTPSNGKKPKTYALSYIAPGSPESDERRFMDAVLAECPGTEQLMVNLDRIDYLPPPSAAGPYLGNLPRKIGLEAVRQTGCRVLLTGQFGDIAMGNVRDLADAVGREVFRLRPTKALSLARQAALGLEDTVWGVLGRSFWSWAPSHLLKGHLLHDSLNRRANRVGPRKTASNGAMAPELEALLPGTAQLLMEPIDAIPSPRPLWLALGFVRHASRRSLQTSTLEPRVLCSHPYTHRPLVEFCLQIPFEELTDPVAPRRLMRRAVADLLPDAVRNRKSKPYVEPFVMRQFRAVVGDMLRNIDRLEVVSQGLALRTDLAKQLEKAWMQSTGLANIAQWTAVEAWLQHRQTRPNRAPESQ